MSTCMDCTSAVKIALLKLFCGTVVNAVGGVAQW